MTSSFPLLDLCCPPPQRPPLALRKNPEKTKRFIPVSIVREDAAPASAMSTPDLSYRFWQDIIAGQPDHETEKENLVVILLSTRLDAYAWHRVSVGTLNETTAHPREILRPVIIGAAYGFVLAHNHPSGDPTPSRADEAITRRISEAATIMQVRLLDHVIIGRPSPGRCGYYSFREAGLIS